MNALSNIGGQNGTPLCRYGAPSPAAYPLGAPGYSNGGTPGYPNGGALGYQTSGAP